MPMYEFYCSDCHMIFTFLSKSVDTRSRPDCPRCGRKGLERQVSAFAVSSGGKEDEVGDGLEGIDESKMESAIEELARESGGMAEDDPRQAARLLRKFAGMTGMKFNGVMEEAISRMEAGEDPDAIESEFGDSMDDEDLVLFEQARGKTTEDGVGSRGAVQRDPTLYEM